MTESQINVTKGAKKNQDDVIFEQLFVKSQNSFQRRNVKSQELVGGEQRRLEKSRRKKICLFHGGEKVSIKKGYRCLHFTNNKYFQSSTIEYMVQRHCHVQQVGTLLDEKGYGIGMKKSKKSP